MTPPSRGSALYAVTLVTIGAAAGVRFFTTTADAAPAAPTAPPAAPVAATTGTPSNADAGTARTAVRYDPRWDESARTLAAALPGAELVRVPGLGATLQVVVGSDYHGPGAPPSAPPPSAPAKTAPASASASPADRTTVFCD